MENSRNFGKRKNPDGSIMEYSSAKQKDKLKRDSIETAMLDFLDDVRATKKQAILTDESIVEIEMMNWIAVNGKTIGSLLDEANVPGHLLADAYQTLSDLELSTIVNMFCAKGQSFTCELFKREMDKMDVKPLVYHKIFKVLTQWKTAVASSGKENCAPSDTSISTVGNDDSMGLINLEDNIVMQVMQDSADPLPVRHDTNGVRWQGR